MVFARKRFGQHFLQPAWVDKVVRAIGPGPEDRFIEIGPGGGALTGPLAARAQSVVACEIDHDLAAALRAAHIPNLTVVEGDFLAIDVRSAIHNPQSIRDPQSAIHNPQSIRDPQSAIHNQSAIRNPPSAIRVAGNLPYNVASPILFKLADLYAAGLPIADATVMLQREVADRLAAKPGSGEYGVLSVLMQHVARVEPLLKLPAGAFRPPPKVLSALVRLRFHAPDPPVADPIVFAAIVQAVFTRRRKTLANALLAYGSLEPAPPLYGGREPGRPRLPTPVHAAARLPTPVQRIAEALKAASLDGARRPETLSVPEFARLADALARG